MPPIVNPKVDQITPDGNVIAESTPQAPVVPPIVEPQAPASPETPVDEAPPKTDETINFDDFINSKNTAEPEKKPEPPKPEPEVQPEPEHLKPGRKKLERDYSDLDEETASLFKNMNNEAYNKLKPIYLEHKALKKNLEDKDKEIATTKKSLEDATKGIVRLPESYYEHHNGYVLTPEFDYASRELNDADIVHQHWVQQLENVREGAKEIEILDRNQNGNWEIVKKIPADSKVETKLLMTVNNAHMQLMQAQARIGNLRENHQNRYQESVKQLQEMGKNYFAAFDREENKKLYEPVIQEFLSKIPPAFRSSPLALEHAKSLTLNVVLGKLLTAAKGTGPTNGTAPAKAPVKRAGPTAAEAAGDGGRTNNFDEVSIDDFNKRKEL